MAFISGRVLLLLVLTITPIFSVKISKKSSLGDNLFTQWDNSAQQRTEKWIEQSVSLSRDYYSYFFVVTSWNFFIPGSSITSIQLTINRQASDTFAAQDDKIIMLMPKKNYTATINSGFISNKAEDVSIINWGFNPDFDKDSIESESFGFAYSVKALTRSTTVDINSFNVTVEYVPWSTTGVSLTTATLTTVFSSTSTIKTTDGQEEATSTSSSTTSSENSTSITPDNQKSGIAGKFSTREYAIIGAAILLVIIIIIVIVIVLLVRRNRRKSANFSSTSSSSEQAATTLSLTVNKPSNTETQTNTNSDVYPQRKVTNSDVYPQRRPTNAAPPPVSRGPSQSNATPPSPAAKQGPPPLPPSRRGTKAGWTSVKDASLAFDPNVRFRRTMEDEHVMLDEFGGKSGDGFFAIYDGHGGRVAAEYVRDNLHMNILKHLNEKKSVIDSIRNGYLDTDKVLCDRKEKSGSTSATAYIKSTPGGKTLYTANIGDARIVLKRGDKAVRLTKDHKASDPAEIARIEGLKGFVMNGKVGGSLAVARAFGDSELKAWVSADPLIGETTLTNADTHLIVACDGLWDVASDEQVVSMMTDGKDSKTLSDDLLKYALENDSRDNISIIVLKL